MFLTIAQFVIVALLIAAVAADQAYHKPAYPAAYPAAYPKTYDYVSFKLLLLWLIQKFIMKF